MKIGDLFERLSDGSVRAKRRVTIKGAQGQSATVSPGTMINAASSVAGVTGQWLGMSGTNDVPPTWVVE